MKNEILLFHIVMLRILFKHRYFWKIVPTCCACVCVVQFFFAQPRVIFVFKLTWIIHVIVLHFLDRRIHICWNHCGFLFDLLHSTGQDLQLPRGKGHRRISRFHTKMPHHSQPSIRIRKTATASGSPYSFRIVRGCFYVSQNYQHSRNCEKGPPAYRPYPRRLESLTICRWNLYKGSTFSSVI